MIFHLISFQNPATPIAEGIIDLHHAIFFFLLLIFTPIVLNIFISLCSNITRLLTNTTIFKTFILIETKTNTVMVKFMRMFYSLGVLLLFFDHNNLPNFEALNALLEDISSELNENEKQKTNILVVGFFYGLLAVAVILKVLTGPGPSLLVEAVTAATPTQVIVEPGVVDVIAETAVTSAIAAIISAEVFEAVVSVVQTELASGSIEAEADVLPTEVPAVSKEQMYYQQFLQYKLSWLQYYERFLFPELAAVQPEVAAVESTAVQTEVSAVQPEVIVETAVQPEVAAVESTAVQTEVAAPEVAAVETSWKEQLITYEEIQSYFSKSKLGLTTASIQGLLDERTTVLGFYERMSQLEKLSRVALPLVFVENNMEHPFVDPAAFTWFFTLSENQQQVLLINVADYPTTPEEAHYFGMLHTKDLGHKNFDLFLEAWRLNLDMEEDIFYGPYYDNSDNSDNSDNEDKESAYF